MVCFHKGHLSVDSLIYNKSVCSPRRNNMSVEKDLRPTGSSTHSLAKIVTIDDLFTFTVGLWVGTIISEVWKLIFHHLQARKWSPVASLKITARELCPLLEKNLLNEQLSPHMTTCCLTSGEDRKVELKPLVTFWRREHFKFYCYFWNTGAHNITYMGRSEDTFLEWVFFCCCGQDVRQTLLPLSFYLLPCWLQLLINDSGRWMSRCLWWPSPETKFYH